MPDRVCILPQSPHLSREVSKLCSFECGPQASRSVSAGSLLKIQNCGPTQTYCIRTCILRDPPGKTHLHGERAGVHVAKGYGEPERGVIKEWHPVTPLLSILPANSFEHPALDPHSIPMDPGDPVPGDFVSTLTSPTRRSLSSRCVIRQLGTDWKMGCLPATKEGFSSGRPWTKKASRVANYLIGSKALTYWAF